MTYQAKLNPSRGLVIERFQPITNYDIQLIRRVLDENDEAVIVVGSAAAKKDPNRPEKDLRDRIMEGGERVELVDHVLRSEGIEPNRYMLIPVENVETNDRQWAAEVRMLTPRWNTFYTRNSTNAVIFGRSAKVGGYDVRMVRDIPVPTTDYFSCMADILKKSLRSRFARKKLADVPYSAFEIMEGLGTPKVIDAIYNWGKIEVEHLRNKIPEAALFLGGFQPFTGVYENRTGHIGVARKILEENENLILAIGSGQVSETPSDPLTSGQRIEVIRYSLMANGIDGGRITTIPIKNIGSNFCYPDKVVSLCPAFNRVYAGNNYTQRAYSQRDIEVVMLERNDGAEGSISGTKVRQTTMDLLLQHRQYDKDRNVSDETVAIVDKALEQMVGEGQREMLRQVGYYEVMDFLADARK